MRRSPLRVVRRTIAVLGLLSTGFFGVGLSSASAQTLPCILLTCNLPSPTALPTALPTVSLAPLPTLSAPLPTLSAPLPTVSLTPLPTLSVALPTTNLPVPTPTPSLPGSTTDGSGGPSPGGGPLDGIVGSSQSPGQSCTLNLQGICVLPANPSPNPGCVVGSSDPTCILGGGTPSGCTSNCSPNGSTGNGAPRQRTGTGSASPQPTDSFSAFGGGGLNGDSAAGGGAAAIPLGLSVATVPNVEQLGPVSGLHFGPALILWPLFGLLDVLGLVAVCLVVRRFRVRSD